MYNISEKTIAIRVSDDFHRKIKMRLAERGVTLKDYIIELIESDLKSRDDNNDKLDEIFSSEDLSYDKLRKKLTELQFLLDKLK